VALNFPGREFLSTGWSKADPVRTQARATRAITTMVERHGGPGSAVIAHLGNRGYRVIAIAADGTFGDAVVPTEEIAQHVCAGAGLTVGSWDRDSIALIAPQGSDRKRMAGTGR